MAGHGGTQEGGQRVGTGLELWEKQPYRPPHLPESPGAEAMCHHTLSSSAKLCLREARDKPPEVCVFDSHLTQQLRAARGAVPAAATESPALESFCVSCPGLGERCE